MPTSNEMIKLEVNGNETGAYLALPAGDGPWPGVVVIQEWWGLEPHIKAVADRFAAEGFVVIAPDLYYGEVATEPDEARKLAMALDWDKALTAIQVAIDTLTARDEVLPKQVGLTGFCMGGGLTWHAAAKLNGVAAAAPFYGGGPEMSDEEVAQISGSVLAIYGELDQGVTPAVANNRAIQMDNAGVNQETIVYPGAKHAFFNDTRAAYHPEAAADAWRRVLDLFNRTLRSPSSAGSDPWNDVAGQFRSLGASLGAALNASLEGEEAQRYLDVMRTGVNAMVDEISQATKSAADSAEGQTMQSEIKKATESVVSAGQQTLNEARPYLLSAFQRVRTELDQLINRMEQGAPASDKPADEAPPPTEDQASKEAE